MSVITIPEPLNPVVAYTELAYYGMQVNGAMEVSQENQLTAISVSNANSPQTLADQWDFFAIGTSVVSAQQISTEYPPGYAYSLKLTVTTAETPLAAGSWVIFYSRIEGYRTARLMFGTSQAQAFSIGFWIKSSLTGAYGIVFRNFDYTRNYSTTFTVNVANTWEWKTLTIPGDTTGDWQKTTAAGLHIIFGLAIGSSTASSTQNQWIAGNYHGVAGTVNFVGTNGAILNLSGVLLVLGNELPSAQNSPYVVIPRDKEYPTCQRYYEKSYLIADVPGKINVVGVCGYSTTGTVLGAPVWWRVRKRVAPALTVYAYGAANLPGNITNLTDSVSVAANPQQIGETGYIENATVTAAKTYIWHYVANAKM